MSRETVTEKALRLLADRRVQVARVVDGSVEAYVRGDHGVYELTSRRGVTTCSCAAWGTCSHRRAVELVAGALVGFSFAGARCGRPGAPETPATATAVAT